MDNSEDSVSLTNVTDQFTYSYPDTITLSSLPTSTTSVTLSPSWTTGTTFTYANTPGYDFGNLTIGSGGNWGQPSSKIQLTGEDADIDINGISLKQTLQSIQDRLNILRPNRELEAEWDQLRELGEQYRKLAQELLEKQKMWNTLKK